jgi:hypothetical protein
VKAERHVEKEKKSEWNRLLKQEKPATQEPAAAPEPVASTAVLPEPHAGTELERTPTRTSSIAEAPITARHTAGTTSPTANEATDTLPKSIKVDKDDKDEKMPSSPSKKRFSTFLTKLKRKPKDKKLDESEKGSFKGGAALTHASHPDAVPRANAPEASPSISSLDSDDDVPEPRGRTKSRMSSGTSDDFEEARDYIDSEGLAPPSTSLSKKTESPARETRFREAL